MKNLEQALSQLQLVQNDPQTLTVVTAKIVCDQIDSQLFDILQVAAIPHWFDVEILATLMQTDTNLASGWLDKLKALPMVERYISRQAWNVHEATRLAIRAQLSTIQPARFLALSNLAAIYFSGDDDNRQVERIYHRLAGGENTADQQLLRFYYHWHIPAVMKFNKHWPSFWKN